MRRKVLVLSKPSGMAQPALIRISNGPAQIEPSVLLTPERSDDLRTDHPEVAKYGETEC